MQLQLSDVDRFTTRQVLETNIHRIRSIAAVHELLSEQSFRLVNVKQVIQRITQTTADMMSTPTLQLSLHVYGEPIQLPSRAATALALVINELLQNALEHAFVDYKVGRVEISLGYAPEEIVVMVKDNGRGFPPDYESGLGLEIAHTLVREDLRGELQFRQLTEGGTEAMIRMPQAIATELD